MYPIRTSCVSVEGTTNLGPVARLDPRLIQIHSHKGGHAHKHKSSVREKRKREE